MSSTGPTRRWPRKSPSARRRRSARGGCGRISPKRTACRFLGQVSAGVAHEINQPLAAIRAYAETGGRLLDAGEAGEARGNFREIVSRHRAHRRDHPVAARVRPARRRRPQAGRGRGGRRRRVDAARRTHPRCRRCRTPNAAGRRCDGDRRPNPPRAESSSTSCRTRSTPFVRHRTRRSRSVSRSRTGRSSSA